jgi:multiple sugar transport system permease protein
LSLTATSSPLRTGADYSRLRTANQRRRQLKRLLVGLAFVSPWLVGFGLFTAYPLLSSLYYSFTRYDLTTAPQFIGTRNYVDLILHDSTFREAIYHTLYFTAASVVTGTLVALALARFLHSITSNIVAALRTVVFLPSILPLVAGTILWLWVLNPSYGIVNRVLSLVGITGPAWFASPNWSVPSLVLLSAWQVGPWVVIYLAALQSIRKDIYEAVAIDGAGPVRTFLKITVPLLSPIILFNVVLNMIAGLQVFTQGFVAGGTDGAPAGSLLFVGTYIYDQAFVQFNVGYASALAWILFVVTGVATIVVTRTLTRFTYYES